MGKKVKTEFIDDINLLNILHFFVFFLFYSTVNYKSVLYIYSNHLKSLFCHKWFSYLFSGWFIESSVCDLCRLVSPLVFHCDEHAQD